MPDGSRLISDEGKSGRETPTGRVTTGARRAVTDSHIGFVNSPGLWAREIGIAADAQSEAVVVDPEWLSKVRSKSVRLSEMELPMVAAVGRN